MELNTISRAQSDVTFVTVASGEGVMTNYEGFCYPQSEDQGGYIFENPNFSEQLYLTMVEEEEDVVCRTLAPTANPTANPTRSPTGMCDLPLSLFPFHPIHPLID